MKKIIIILLFLTNSLFSQVNFKVEKTELIENRYGNFYFYITYSSTFRERKSVLIDVIFYDKQNKILGQGNGYGFLAPMTQSIIKVVCFFRVDGIHNCKIITEVL